MTTSNPNENFKGHCSTCNKPVYNENLYANDNIYHVTCFKCDICDKDLSEDNYIALEGKIYCEKDYYDRILGGCFACKKTLESEYIEPDQGKKFHRSCFACNVCKCTLSNKYFSTEDSKYYCESCFEKLHYPMCSSCNEMIKPTENDREIISSGDNKYHSKCFCCTICRSPFLDLQAYHLNEKFYCADHYITVVPKQA
jgi:hypothetical protein